VTTKTQSLLVFLCGTFAFVWGAGTAAAQTILTVAADGSGQFKTVQEAINAVPQTTRFDQPAIIRVKPGIYRELIYVQHEKRFVHLIGEDPEKTVFTYNLHANMLGLDGKPRALHPDESLASIDFADYEPRSIASKYSPNPKFAVRLLVDDPLFKVDACRVQRRGRFHLRSESLQILGMVRGRLQVTHDKAELALKAGEFCLLPASLGRVSFLADAAAEFLHVQAALAHPQT